MAVITCTYFSHARKARVTFNAVLPTELPPGPSTENEGKDSYAAGPYPTIYLLHGYTGGYDDWLINSPVVEWAAKHRYAIIMPGASNDFYLDNEDTEEKHGEWIGRELVDVTRKMFPLSHQREDTVLGGFSMGGFGAIRNGMKYCDTFGSIIALSSALITDEISNMKEGDHTAIAGYRYYRHVFGNPACLLGTDKDPKHLAGELVTTLKNLPRLFLACGTEDFLYAKNEDFHQHLDIIAYPHTWVPFQGVHNFEFWNKAMEKALDWLRSNPDNPVCSSAKG